ncbi:MAG: hypothetical protein ABI065_03640 [Terrimesophilobacter sp.]
MWETNPHSLQKMSFADMVAPHCRQTTAADRSTDWSTGAAAAWLRVAGSRGTDLPHSPQNNAPSGSAVPQYAQFTADLLVA